MGAVHVDVAIRNPADPSRSWRSGFLAGTQAMNTALQSMGVEVDVARQRLRKLPAVRLKPVRRLPRTASPAGGSPKG